jgi:hypothetical protein
LRQPNPPRLLSGSPSVRVSYETQRVIVETTKSNLNLQVAGIKKNPKAAMGSLSKYPYVEDQIVDLGPSVVAYRVVSKIARTANGNLNAVRQAGKYLTSFGTSTLPVDPGDARRKICVAWTLKTLKPGQIWTRKKLAKNLLCEWSKEAMALGLDLCFENALEVARWISNKRVRAILLACGVAVKSQRTNRGVAYHFALLPDERSTKSESSLASLASPHTMNFYSKAVNRGI